MRVGQGNLRIEVANIRDPYWQYIASELNSVPTSVESYGPTVRLAQRLSMPDQDRIQHQGRFYRAEIAPAGDGADVTVATSHSLLDYPLLRRSPRWAVRSIHWSHLDQYQHAAKVFLYDVWDPIVQAVQVERAQQTFLHASGLEVAAKRLIFMAEGGVGKSTALIGLMARDSESRYIGDDLVLLSPSGDVIPCPKRIQLYAYSVPEELEDDLLSSRMDRLTWRLSVLLRGPRRTRRRIAPSDLYGQERVSSGGPPDRVIHLRLTDGQRGLRHRVGRDAGTAADEHAEIVRAELKYEGPLLRSAYGTRIVTSRGPDQLQERTREIVRAGLSGRELHEVDVPIGTAPQQFMDFLIERLEL